ncbi:MAG: response regulator transcription factor [Anaerolineales bacterium]|nr:MAG: response regulator transcription factor [Anaerolineales bacterium]
MKLDPNQHQIETLPMIRIVIVDDHALFREGLASILKVEPDLEVSGLAGSVQEAVELVRRLKPDIVLMDFSLPDGTGVDATRLVLKEYPDCKIIFLTMSASDEYLFSAIRSGAKGYLLKNMSPSKLVTTIRSVQQGESALSRSMTLRLMEELSRTKEAEPFNDPSLADLTRREGDVLRELVGGGSNREIAARLYLSENTIKYHVHSILSKLNLPDRRAAAEFAREHGITD